MTKCDENVTSHHFVTVPHSNPGPGSGNITGRNDPQNISTFGHMAYTSTKMTTHTKLPFVVRANIYKVRHCLLKLRPKLYLEKVQSYVQSKAVCTLENCFSSSYILYLWCLPFDSCRLCDRVVLSCQFRDGSHLGSWSARTTGLNLLHGAKFQRHKCFSELKISNPRISYTLSGVRRSSWKVVGHQIKLWFWNKLQMTDVLLMQLANYRYILTR